MPCCLTQKQELRYSVEGEHVQRLEVVSRKLIGFKEKVLQLTIQIQSIIQNHFRVAWKAT